MWVFEALMGGGGGGVRWQGGKPSWKVNADLQCLIINDFSSPLDI